jgi:hypothetical protein
MTMMISGNRVRRTRLVRTDRLVVAVDVEAVIPDADPSEPVYESETVELLRQVELLAQQGDVDRLRRLGKVYAEIDT